MAVMMGNLYRALKNAGVEDDAATQAAEEVAGYDNRLSGIEARVTLLTWMVGTNVALSIAVLGIVLGKLH
jgi:hypothetical protein